MQRMSPRAICAAVWRLGEMAGSYRRNSGKPCGGGALGCSESSGWKTFKLPKKPSSGKPWRLMEDVLPYSLCKVAPVLGLIAIWSMSSAPISLMVTSLLLLFWRAWWTLPGEWFRSSPSPYFASRKLGLGGESGLCLTTSSGNWLGCPFWKVVIRLSYLGGGPWSSFFCGQSDTLARTPILGTAGVPCVFAPGGPILPFKAWSFLENRSSVCISEVRRFSSFYDLVCCASGPKDRDIHTWR